MKGGGRRAFLDMAVAAAAAAEEDRAEFKGRVPMGMRKKGIGRRMWLVINSSGTPQVVEAGKHAIMRRTSLPARDLRILDPLLSYPSTILGREHAIVVNLEHIKAIISAHEVLLLNSKDPQVSPFVEDLRRRLPVHYNELGQQVPGDGGGGMSDSEMLGSSPDDIPHVGGNGETAQPSIGSKRSTKGGPSALPFEFRALEACLEAACSCLDAETNALEKQAYPILDELTSKISTLNLERVRLIKSRLVAISGRVQKVRDEIEQLLDDDGDMAEMYLTSKLSRQQVDVTASPPGPDGPVEMPVEPQVDEENDERPLKSRLDSFRGAFERTLSSSTSSSSSGPNHGKHLDVEELEMLLEAYFVQIDGTLNKLSTLREYVDDTEDYINIMLDDKQNQLLQMGVMLTTATLVVSAFIVVTGIFGMNIQISLFHSGTFADFLWVVGGTGVGGLVLYFLVIAWCKWQRLLG